MRPSMAFVLALVVACRRDPVDATPDVPEGAPAPPPAELSRFSAPLAYDFASVLRIVDRAVPMTFGSLDSVRTLGDDSRRHYAFAAEREPFVAYAEGNVVHLRAIVAYSARGYYKPPLAPTMSGGCGGERRDERPRLLIELAAPLELTSQWRLRAATTVVRVEPASHDQRDRCDVTFLHHDVTDRVVAAARAGITEHLADIDRRIAAIDLHERFTGLWKLLGAPIQVSDGVWLTLNPRRLAIGRVSGRGHVLTIPVTLEARPEIVTASMPPEVSLGALPPLGRDSLGSGFHIRLDGTIDYLTASKVVNRALEGRVITQAGRTVRVTRALLAPAPRGQLALAVSFTGDARGTLRFIGTPRLDATRHEITMPDLDYALATDNPLIDTYAWLRSDAMRTAFRDRAHLPVDSALVQGRELLRASLNRRVGDMMTMNATVNDVGVRALYVTRAGIVVRGEALGRAGVAVRAR